MDRFEALPTPQKFLIGFLLMALVAGLAYFVFIDDLNGEIASSESKIRQMEQKAQQLKKYESGDLLTALEAEEKDLRDQLAANKALLPEEEKIPALITSIKRQADERGLRIKRFEKKTRVKDDYVNIIPVKMEVEGSFPVVISFFEALAQPGMRMMTVDEINIRALPVSQLMDDGEPYKAGRAIPPSAVGRDTGEGEGDGNTPAHMLLKKIESYEKAVNRMRVNARFTVNAYSYTGELLTDDERRARKAATRRPARRR